MRFLTEIKDKYPKLQWRRCFNPFNLEDWWEPYPACGLEQFNAMFELANEIKKLVTHELVLILNESRELELGVLVKKLRVKHGMDIGYEIAALCLKPYVKDRLLEQQGTLFKLRKGS